MNIKVIGSGCDNCNALYANVWAATVKSGVQAEIERVEDLIEIVKLGVMSVPAVMIDGKLVISGRVAEVDEIVKFLKK